MFAEHMKRGNPWDEDPFGRSVLHGHGSSGGSSSAAEGSSSSSDAGHFIPIRILEQNLKNKLQDQLHDMDMDFDFEPSTKGSMGGRVGFPDSFKQAEEDFRSKVANAKNRMQPNLIPGERSSRAGSPFMERMAAEAAHHRPHSPQNHHHQQPQHTASSARANSPGSNTIRHIPIIVEGKQQQANAGRQSPKTQQQQSQPENNSNKKDSSSRQGTPTPKLDPIPLPPPPPHDDPTAKNNSKAPSPPPRSPKNKSAENIFNQQDDLKSNRIPTQPAPAPTAATPNPPAAPVQGDESPVPPPVKKPTPACSQLEKVEAISQDVKQLEKEVAAFQLQGTVKNKDYLFLDELLTRNLIKLDSIETEGKEDVRLARKDCIKLIQKCISDLETKLQPETTAPPQQPAVIDPSTAVALVTSTTPPVVSKSEKQPHFGTRKARSEPPFHRSEISIEVNQGEKKDPPPAGDKAAGDSVNNANNPESNPK